MLYLQIGEGQMDDSVKAARPREGSIQSSWPVCGCHDNHSCVVFKAIHLRQQLVDGLHTLCRCMRDGSPSELRGIKLVLCRNMAVMSAVMRYLASVPESFHVAAGLSLIDRQLTLKLDTSLLLTEL